MGFMDELKKLARPFPEDDEDYEDEYGELDDKAAARPATNGSAAVATETAYAESPVIASASTASYAADRSGSKVVNLHNNPSTAAMQVVLVKPDRYDAVGDIANHLREKHAVLLNLEDASKDVARRVVDFLSGCAFALDGKIKKVAVSTYIIVPYNVDIIGDLLDELESNGMYV